jgi:hypothetical protein
MTETTDPENQPDTEIASVEEILRGPDPLAGLDPDAGYERPRPTVTEPQAPTTPGASADDK